jgi:DNA-binding NarL/FixJ family response regulator
LRDTRLLKMMVEKEFVLPMGTAGYKTRIVLVEPHAVLREGLRALIAQQSEFEVVGEFSGLEVDLADIVDLRPDIVITELDVAGRPGVELLAVVHRLCPDARKLVLTERVGEECIRAALGNGADGYVSKDAGSVELMVGIRSVMRSGERYLCKTIASKILSSYGSKGELRQTEDASQGITSREREVLTRIARGDSNKAIARDLGLSPKTIEKHRSNLMRKLRLHNAAAITMYAIQHGYTDEDPALASAAVARRHSPTN